MRKLEVALLFTGVLAFTACGSSGGGSKDGGAGKGGHGGGGSGGTGGTGNVGGGTAGGGGTGNVAGSMAGAGGSMAGSGGSMAGMDGGAGADAATDTPVDMATGDVKTDATDSNADALTAQQSRGLYMISTLGCMGCHGTNLAGNRLIGQDTATNGKLYSANLTNASTIGIKDFSDQAIIDAIRTGKDPDQTGADGGTIYLFANMPYYQYSTLTDDDAKAIVAYLRTVPAVTTAVTGATGKFATPPTSPEWTGLTLAQLPMPVVADGGADGGTASEMNGKYFASLLCVNCHTVNTAASAPLAFDTSKAFQGGKTVSVTLTVPIDAGADAGDAGPDAATTMMETFSVETANLTPDSTGLASYSAAQIATSVTAAKDKMSRAICGMRANAGISAADATDLANYLQSIPAVTNATGGTCYDM
jgi:cytochrome c553